MTPNNNPKLSTAKTFGELLKTEMEKNPKFYFFSPDETTSNKLDSVFEATERAWNLPKKSQDMKESEDGRIIEMLSENTLFAVMLGHILNGEPAAMTSYESFFTIIASQILQHLKFLDQSEKVSWRPEYPAVNLLSTSTCWRQDHNGFSHQSPALISTLLERPGNKVNCFFPVDSESARATFKYLQGSRNVVNLVTFNKTDEPQFIDEGHANFQFESGASIFGFCSDGNPFDLSAEENKFDFIFASCGDIATREAVEAVKLLKYAMPELKIRLVNILALSHGKIGTVNQPMSQELFDLYFKTGTPIITNFHGYKDTLKNILGNYTDSRRISAHGFEEHGTTTTPLKMLMMNHASRFDLAKDVAEKLKNAELAQEYQKVIDANHANAIQTGVDLFEV